MWSGPTCSWHPGRRSHSGTCPPPHCWPWRCVRRPRVWLDEGRKRTLYEEYGVASCWLVDPLRPAVTVLELVDGRYTQVATAAGDQSIELTAPFPVALNPAQLAEI
jgi:hypothetical protein